jgi:asparagine synthase (glutamine-hydrolysing)
MFAFALFDATTAHGGPRLLLARDRFGIKPLYYFQDRERVVFSSEVRALLSGGLVPDTVDPEGLLQFLQLGSVPAPLTTMKGVRAMPAAHYIVVQNGSIETKCYWDLADVLSAEPAALSHDAAVAETRRVLEETVSQHLLSDVPLGIFLSGGIDSSALVGLASAVRPSGLVTLAITFEEDAYNEAAYALRVARHYHTDHREILLRHGDFRAEFPRIFKAMDQPTLDGVNTYFVSKAARAAGLTVVLSGRGADELFSGYRHLQRAQEIDRLLRAVAAVPGWLRRPLLDCASPVARRFFPRAANKLWCLRNISSATPYWLARGLFSPSAIGRLLGSGIEEVRRSSFRLGPEAVLDNLSPEQRIRFLEYRQYLQNQLLKDSDVMSMAHSLELRVPFLDHELISRVLRMPGQAQSTPRIPKRLLVEAMGPDFPREVWQRPKQGFTFPIGEWMKQDGGELEAMALEGTPLEKAAVRDVWADFRAGRLHWSRPWMTVVAARFYGK